MEFNWFELKFVLLLDGYKANIKEPSLPINPFQDVE